MGVADSQSVIDALAELDISKQEVLTLPLPVSLGGTGVDARQYITPSSSLGILMTGNGETGDISNWTTVDALAGYVNSVKTQPEIAAAFESRTADAVADNGLLPTGNAVTSFMNTSLRSVKPLRVSAVSRLTSGTPSVGTVTIIGGDVYEVNGLTTGGNNKIYHVMATIRLKLPNIAAGENVSIPEFMLFTVNNSMTNLYLSPGSTMVIRPDNKATKFYVGIMPNKDQAVSVDIVSPSMHILGNAQPNDGILFPATTFFNTSNITLSDNVQLICDLTFYKES